MGCGGATHGYSRNNPCGLGVGARYIAPGAGDVSPLSDNRLHLFAAGRDISRPYKRGDAPGQGSYRAKTGETGVAAPTGAEGRKKVEVVTL